MKDDCSKVTTATRGKVVASTKPDDDNENIESPGQKKNVRTIKKKLNTTEIKLFFVSLFITVYEQTSYEFGHQLRCLYMYVMKSKNTKHELLRNYTID